MDLPAFIPLGTRVLCLYRVSTGQQLYRTENNEADIPMQRKRCRQFAEQMGWTVVCELQEEGVSGHKVRAENRDKIQTIKDYATKGELQTVHNLIPSIVSLTLAEYDAIAEKDANTLYIIID